jgi:hypothetical protein
MNDLLFTAAKQLGVATEVSAGPGEGFAGAPIWARWPRHPLEVAQEMLNQIAASGEDVHVRPLGATPLWRARRGSWTYIGRFEDAVAHLAMHVVEGRCRRGLPPDRDTDRAAPATAR